MANPLKAFRARSNLTQEALASMLGVQKAAVCKWERKQVPAERVLHLEQITGISRHHLRPDVFGPP